MKQYNYILILGFLMFIFVGCKTQQSAVEQQKLMIQLEEILINKHFTFNAQHVIPSSQFQSRFLTSSYNVKLSGDTLYSYLPYFGIAYQSQFGSNQSPLNFTSTRFDYEVRNGKKKGTMQVEINIKDQQYPVKYFFTIWDNGKADLLVQSYSRQPISFYGEMETEQSLP